MITSGTVVIIIKKLTTTTMAANKPKLMIGMTGLIQVAKNDAAVVTLVTAMAEPAFRNVYAIRSG